MERISLIRKQIAAGRASAVLPPLAGVAAMVVGGAWVLSSCAKEDRPRIDPRNVILISVDTLRADRLNCYGYADRITSPNIDALARNGVLFAQHTAASPWTTPSHMSLLTSLYPSAHGVTQSFAQLRDQMSGVVTFNSLSEDRTTLAEVLRGAGFSTAAFTAGAGVDPKIGFGQGFSVYGTSMYKLGRTNVQEMFDWLDSASSGRFFLFWHTFEVHYPYLEPEFLSEVLSADDVAAIAHEFKYMKLPLANHFPTIFERRPIKIRFNDLLVRHGAYNREVCEALYTGGIRSFDRWFGKLIADLRRRGMYDRTMIVLTSDHGDEFGERSDRSVCDCHGHTLYEELVRVPLIIKLFDSEGAGTRINTPVSNIDVMPTILDVVGLSLPKDGVQGKSLRPLWESGETQDDRVIISESLAFAEEKKSVRVGRYKFIVTMDGRTVGDHGRNFLPETLARRELYDLANDPMEVNNLLDAEGEVEHEELADLLERALRETVSQRQGEVGRVRLDGATVEQLKSMGYIR